MTPQEFHDTYRPTANAVSAGTGIDPIVLLAQWANETAWGTVVVGFNLGNIRSAAGPFLRFNSLGDFALECIATWHNGFYPGVLAAVGPEAQLAAVCASPWSSGHYGGNLHPFYDPLEAYEMTPDQAAQLLEIRQIMVGQEESFWDVEIKQILALVKALPTTGASGGTTDLTPVLTAIASSDADLDTAIGNLGTLISANTAALTALTAKLGGLTLKAQ